MNSTTVTEPAEPRGLADWYALWALAHRAVARFGWKHWMKLWTMILSAGLGLWSWLTVLVIIIFDLDSVAAATSMLSYVTGASVALLIHAAVFRCRLRKSA